MIFPPLNSFQKFKRVLLVEILGNYFMVELNAQCQYQIHSPMLQLQRPSSSSADLGDKMTTSLKGGKGWALVSFSV